MTLQSPDAPLGEEGHISSALTMVVLRLVRSAGGAAGVRELLIESGSRRREAFLEEVGNWISKDEAVALLTAGTRVTGDAAFARRVGETAVSQHAGTPVATLLRSLGSPEAVLGGITMAAAKFSTVTEMKAGEARPGRAVVTAAAREGFERHELLCLWTVGLLSQATVLFGLPPAHVEETECQRHGAPKCRYTVSWDAELATAAADPEQRLIAVEAQLAAMSDRMESAFATASDLVSPDDLDTVLARIVDRAAHALRAPAYVLAVRAKAGGEPTVFSDGLSIAQAEELGREVLERGLGARDSYLAAAVASSRRDYGVLLALYPGGGGTFFPQEQQLLTLYAKHAAAVLDMATALQDAARRHEQSTALLTLSHSLARAGTGPEVAARLAEAVPQVVDCDRMGVWLWDHVTRGLTSTSNAGFGPQDRTHLDGFTLRPEESLTVRRVLADHRTLFLDPQTDDPYVRALMRRLGLLVLVVVPIVARDQLLGVLNVGVVERPARLTPGAGLLERLTGVAALAAPAILNGQLVDELNHEATHDALTGLLDRAGFALSMRRALRPDRRADDRFGLLFVDLDDFKQVNDAYGHEAGDLLLRMAAQRLEEALRSADGVARIGGDEFAAILTDVQTDDTVRVAAERVRAAFEQPFDLRGVPVRVTASVGEATWPDHGPGGEELMGHADAEMYRRKADRRRAEAGVG